MNDTATAVFTQNSPCTLSWRTYESRFEDDKKAIYVDADNREISVSVLAGKACMNYRLSPAVARALAAELIAAADASERA